MLYYTKISFCSDYVIGKWDILNNMNYANFILQSNKFWYKKQDFSQMFPFILGMAAAGKKIQ